MGVYDRHVDPGLIGVVDMNRFVLIFFVVCPTHLGSNS